MTAMKLKASSNLFITCLLLICIESAFSLRCYSCLTKMSDPSSCTDPYVPQEYHEKVCSPKYHNPVCFKVVIENHASQKMLGEKLYSRGCVSEKDFADVASNKHAEEGVVVLQASQCKTDLCNK